MYRTQEQGAKGCREVHLASLCAVPAGHKRGKQVTLRVPQHITASSQGQGEVRPVWLWLLTDKCHSLQSRIWHLLSCRRRQLTYRDCWRLQLQSHWLLGARPGAAAWTESPWPLTQALEPASRLRRACLRCPSRQTCWRPAWHKQPSPVTICHRDRTAWVVPAIDSGHRCPLQGLWSQGKVQAWLRQCRQHASSISFGTQQEVWCASMPPSESTAQQLLPGAPPLASAAVSAGDP